MQQLGDNPSPTAHLPNERETLDQWLVARRNAGTTPPAVAHELVAAGWSVDAASDAALRSLRSNDRQDLLWFSLCWSTGLCAVGFTTAIHQLLALEPNWPLAAFALTVSLVAAPIAVVSECLARRSEARSRFTVWSPSRRAWFGTLASCTAVVGLVRVVRYLYAVILSMVDGRHGPPLAGQALAQVMVSLAVAVPLFVWSFLQWRRSNVAIAGLGSEVDR